MKKTVCLLAILMISFGCAKAPLIKKDTPVVFYPALPEKPRLQFLHAITIEEDIGKTQSAFDEFLLGKSEALKKIGKPYDIASSQGKIYLMDRKYRKMVIIDLAAKRFDVLMDQRLGALNDPSGIWVTRDEIKYIADMKRKQVVVFDQKNHFLKAYGSKKLLDKPVDVAVYDKSVYICDMDKNRVVVLDKDTGKHKLSIGELGTDPGRLYKPTHVVVDNEGNIFVNDAFNFRIQKFDADGNFLKSIGFLGDNIGGFARPKGLDIDKEGHLYVADAAFENVQIFDEKTGKLLLFFGGPGTGPGNMYLPAGVHIDYENMAYFKKFVDKDFQLQYLLYVGNTFGHHRLNVYGFGEWKGQSPSGE